MDTRPTRERFALADALILVGALAAGFALSRSAWLAITYTARMDDGRIWYSYHAVAGVLTVATPPVATLALGLLACRLRRPQRRRLARQPGVAACLSTAGGLLYDVGLYVTAWLAGVRGVDHWSVWEGLPSSVVLLQFGAWGAVALSGRLRATPGWIDRSGRAVGVAWIALWMLHMARYFLM